jgi:phage N-6-adenine-methyltransferase
MVLAIAEARAVDEVKGILDPANAMRAAARVAKNKQAEIDLSEIRFRAERRIGELMVAQRDAGHLQHGGARVFPEPLEKPITLAEAGIDKNLADRARKYAAIPEAEFDDTLADWRSRVEQENERVTVSLLAAGDKHIHRTGFTGNNEWYTPAEYIELARKVLGTIQLDPASSEAAQKVVKAKTFYTEADDGLAQEWSGKVWLNPPYAQPAIAHFIEKLVSEVEAGRVTEALLLTHNYTDTAWFHRAAFAASAICFTEGRIRFVDTQGTRAAPTQGQAFFYFGKRIQTFTAHFRDVGFIAEVRHG